MSKYGFFDFLMSMSTIITDNFPVISLPDGSMNVFNNVHDYVAVISHYIPTDVFMECFIIMIGVWITLAVISIVLQLL